MKRRHTSKVALPPGFSKFAEMAKEKLDPISEIFEGVIIAFHGPIETRQAMSGKSEAVMMKVLVTEHVLRSFADAVDADWAYEALRPLGMPRTGSNGDELVLLLDMPETDIGDWIARDKALIIKRLARFAARLLELAEEEMRLELAGQTSMEGGDVLTLLELRPRQSPAVKIPFFHEQAVTTRDLRKTASRPPLPIKSAPAIPAPSSPQKPETHRDVQAYQQRVGQLADQVADLTRRLATSEATRLDEDSAAVQRGEIERGLRARVLLLEHAVKAARADSPAVDNGPTLPQSWAELKPFADRHLAGRVVITAKAYRAARSSPFVAVEFAYDVLLMLARDYVPMRCGEVGAKQRFGESIKRLRVQVGPTGTAADQHMTKDAYRVVHLGKLLTMDLHVQGSSSRDPREGFRLYFGWVPTEDGGGYVVIGSFPGHLESTLS